MSAETVPDVERDAYAFAKARAAMETDPFQAAARLLSFLQGYPSDRHSREAAETVEAIAAGLRSRAKRELLTARLRELRDPHLPPIHPSSWKMSESRRRLLALEEAASAESMVSSED